MACTNAVGKFTPSLVTFEGKKYRPEFAAGFPNGPLVAMTGSVLINEDFQHLAQKVVSPCFLLPCFL